MRVHGIVKIYSKSVGVKRSRDMGLLRTYFSMVILYKLLMNKLTVRIYFILYNLTFQIRSQSLSYLPAPRSNISKLSPV